eukprot:6923565-Prymnesium_polylepis.1
MEDVKKMHVKKMVGSVRDAEARAGGEEHITAVLLTEHEVSQGRRPIDRSRSPVLQNRAEPADDTNTAARWDAVLAGDGSRGRTPPVAPASTLTLLSSGEKLDLALAAPGAGDVSMGSAKLRPVQKVESAGAEDDGSRHEGWQGGLPVEHKQALNPASNEPVSRRPIRKIDQVSVAEGDAMAEERWHGARLTGSAEQARSAGSNTEFPDGQHQVAQVDERHSAVSDHGLTATARWRTGPVRSVDEIVGAEDITGSSRDQGGSEVQQVWRGGQPQTVSDSPLEGVHVQWQGGRPVRSIDEAGRADDGAVGMADGMGGPQLQSEDGLISVAEAGGELRWRGSRPQGSTDQYDAAGGIQWRAAPPLPSSAEASDGQADQIEMLAEISASMGDKRRTRWQSGRP